MESEDRSTRHRVTALLLEHGPQTASELAGRLGVSPAAVRRHLDALLGTGRVEERQAPGTRRGRGRPARQYHLTDVGRSTFPHAYDDLALTALRHIASSQGPEAVRVVAEAQLSGLEQRCSTAVEQATAGSGDAPVDRAQALATALTAEGYAAAASTIAGGGQLCQHHCPVAHVAAEFPQLCEAETAVIGRLVGTHVQRLATIAHGDGVCTTHIPGPRPAAALRGVAGHTRAGNRTTSARPVPGESRAPRAAIAAPSTSPTQTHRERTPA
ncbi:metalloregulator ArsR/SmtB family transcription factor [Blastococcus sp. TF02A-26]|uniref:helix-turn-helix transcriptional regulator n=1 Tax=Blastococcus sp. TF02A-26 TaxID=2250577 RepID=UPI0027147F46|nr:ArsR family transcriptional regulator [Blastococcus sp. TF02A-26]